MELGGKQKVMYENANYSYALDYGDGQQSKTVIAHIILDADQTDFDVFMSEKVIIDKSADVFLDSFTTFNCKANTSKDNMGFILSIEQLEVKSVSNNSSVSRSVFIPNEQKDANVQGTKTHKGKKMNFISTLNPKSKYDRLTGSIKTLGGGAIFNPESGNPLSTHGGAIVLELLIVDRKN